MNLKIPQNAVKLMSSCTTGSFSRRAQLYAVSWLAEKIQFQWQCSINIFNLGAKGVGVVFLNEATHFQNGKCFYIFRAMSLQIVAFSIVAQHNCEGG
jgi:hypothetical protein